MVGGRVITEASGRITAATAPAIAATGVDLIVGWLTHSAAALDIGLDYLELDVRAARERSPSLAAITKLRWKREILDETAPHREVPR